MVVELFRILMPGILMSPLEAAGTLPDCGRNWYLHIPQSIPAVVTSICEGLLTGSYVCSASTVVMSPGIHFSTV